MTACCNPQCDEALPPGAHHSRRYCCEACRLKVKYAKRAERYQLDREKELSHRKQWRQSINGIRSRFRRQRKGRLNGTMGYVSREKYLEAQRHQNQKPERKERRRQWARDHQRVYINGKVPRCAECGVEIEWSRVGRPRKLCPQHGSPSSG